MYRMVRTPFADIVERQTWPETDQTGDTITYVDRQAWAILDPSGDTITFVYNQESAEGLLTHLNR